MFSFGRLKWSLYAILSVLLIVLFSQGLMRVPYFANVLGVYDATNMYLKVETVDTVEQIAYGTQAEIYRFKIDSNASYTMRYITLSINSEGLKLATNPFDFKIYRVRNGKIDFLSLVGYGEKFYGNQLKMRMFPSPDFSYAGFLGMPYNEEFAVVSSVLKDGTDNTNNVFLEAQLLNGSFDDNSFAFKFGHDNRSWMNIDSILTAQNIDGLPTDLVNKL